MNENASLAVNATRGGLAGLPQRLVEDGVVDESGMHAAMLAAVERKTSFITQLVKSGAASAREIAIAAATEYGVPLMDLTAMSTDQDTFRGINNGWPAVISSLKSLLETGTAISFVLPKDSQSC